MISKGDAIQARLDVGGLSVCVRAVRATLLERCIARFGGRPATATADLELVLADKAPSKPTSGLDQSIEGYDGRSNSEQLWISRGTAAVMTEGARIEVGGPTDDPVAAKAYDHLLQFGLAAAVASPTRVLIHAAVIARGDEAIAAVAMSGQGKSTLAASAQAAGWDLLGDDLAVVDLARRRIQAVRRPPMMPLDIARQLGLDGESELGDRARLRQPIDVLVPGSRSLIGMVSIEHGETGHIEAAEAGELTAFDDALAVPPFSSVVRRHLPAAAAIVALPTVVLHHAADSSRRVVRAQQLLEEAFAHCQDAKQES